MIVFLTVLILSLHIFVLFNGRLFPEFRKEIAENEIKKQRVGVDRFVTDDELGIKAIAYLFLFAIPVMLLHVFLISVGLMNDPYLYPSLGMLTFIIVNIVIQALTNKKEDLTVESNAEEYREKLTRQHSVKNKLVLLVYIAYLVYLLWVFVG